MNRRCSAPRFRWLEAFGTRGYLAECALVARGGLGTAGRLCQPVGEHRVGTVTVEATQREATAVVYISLHLEVNTLTFCYIFF